MFHESSCEARANWWNTIHTFAMKIKRYKSQPTAGIENIWTPNVIVLSNATFVTHRRARPNEIVNSRSRFQPAMTNKHIHRLWPSTINRLADNGPPFERSANISRSKTTISSMISTILELIKLQRKKKTEEEMNREKRNDCAMNECAKFGSNDVGERVKPNTAAATCRRHSSLFMCLVQYTDKSRFAYKA